MIDSPEITQLLYPPVSLTKDPRAGVFPDCSLLFFFFDLFAFSRAAPAACGGSQSRGLIGAVADGLRQSHSNV